VGYRCTAVVFGARQTFALCTCNGAHPAGCAATIGPHGFGVRVLDSGGACINCSPWSEPCPANMRCTRGTAVKGIGPDYMYGTCM
jgi:hypothetical protein